MANQPYHQFKTAIANKLIDDNAFNKEWFDGQESRLQMFWENEETAESAYDVIGAIAKAKFSADYYREPTIKGLVSVGCEFIRA